MVSHRAVQHTEAEVSLQIGQVRVCVGIEQVALAQLRLLHDVAPVVEERSHGLVELDLELANALGERHETRHGQQILATCPAVGGRLDVSTSTGFHLHDGRNQRLGVQVFAELPGTVGVVGLLGVASGFVILGRHLRLVDGQGHDEGVVFDGHGLLLGLIPWD